MCFQKLSAILLMFRAGYRWFVVFGRSAPRPLACMILQQARDCRVLPQPDPFEKHLPANDVDACQYADDDVDVIEEVLKLTNNIYEVYCDAGFEAKRHYLAIFFERFDVKNKKVAKVTYTPLFKKLLDSRKVRVSSNWLPKQDSN